MLSHLPRKALAGIVAGLFALAVAAPANAATMIERSGEDTSLNFSYSWGATSLNFTQPSDTAFNFTKPGG